ncbi:hypothetical protein VHEMI04050 [[Torrubiella] hemipterigena]|uniref:Uncharacterized protein n=1 Tax=[Torrubiella] hemipterigena TaxID=1531966 RepID=A0A0A1SU84_9HYPO|nr:hypothetical protein VHEMI04050 [[Torrubiella] hemipterigena]
MRFTSFVLAALPALALADGSVTSSAPTTITTTCTLTDKVTKTMTLSKVTVTSIASNSTSSWVPIPTSSAPAIVNPPTPGKNAAGALDASKVAFAGVAGMVAIALL